MDWYENLWEEAPDLHQPEEHEGREWDELTDDERVAIITERADDYIGHRS